MTMSQKWFFMTENPHLWQRNIAVYGGNYLSPDSLIYPYSYMNVPFAVTTLVSGNIHKFKAFHSAVSPFRRRDVYRYVGFLLEGWSSSAFIWTEAFTYSSSS